MSELDSTFGAILLGLVVGSILFGLTTLQTHLYYQRFPHDTLWVKCFVAMIWMFDALHVALCTHVIYHYLITNFGNKDALAHEIWSMAIQTDCNGIIGMSVELFFARRVFKLSRNYLITGIITIFALTHFSLGIYFTVQGFVLKDYSKFDKLIWVTCVGLGSAAAADIIIAISLVYSLQSVRTGIQKTDNIISTLIVYAINTGVVTSMVATICVFCFAFMPRNFVWLSFFWILGKLYANSLLANLNSREALRGRGNNEGEGTVILPLSQLSDARSPQKSRYSVQGQPGLKINVTTETYHEHYSSNSPATGQSSQAPWIRHLHISEPVRNPKGLESLPEFASIHTSMSQSEKETERSRTFAI